MNRIKKKLGFGCMRLPMRGEDVDLEQFSKMTDLFMENGFNYFDTAQCYIDGKSETAIRECVSKRYPRDSFILTDKLTDCYFEKEADIIPFFNSQLEATGVEYFDFYLMHALNAENYKKYINCNAFKVAQNLKREGKIRHIGISFHDSADVLNKILTEHPEVEVVQIQFNYLDYEDAGVQGKQVYEVCRKHGKPVLIMEPVKGGSLVNLPKSAKDVLDKLNGGSYASYAIRFAAGFDGVISVLSGMSTLEQAKDNIGFMKNFKPLSDAELKAVGEAAELLKKQDSIPCTACRYCIDGCPKNIDIPALFSCMNAKSLHKDWNSDVYYEAHAGGKNGKASDCIKCGKCEKICPQHLKIRDLLEDVAKTFEG